MKRKGWAIGIALLWLALPAVGLRYLLLWAELPAVLATHFNAAGHPNGWMSREQSFYFAVGLMVFVLSVATAVLAFIQKPEGPAWALLALFYVIVGVIYSIEDGILAYNLHARPIQLGVAIPVMVVAIVVVVITFLAHKRGTRLTSSVVLAEEVHSAPLWALVFFLPVLVETAVMVTVPMPVFRLGLAISILVLLGAGAMAWSGFHYVFTPEGLEVRTLGLRLRSIPRESIRRYVAGGWSGWRGYGIRGIGGSRGYVWGNQGVRIHTSDGEVFLGHSEPERIVRDLDLITQEKHSSASVVS